MSPWKPFYHQENQKDSLQLLNFIKASGLESDLRNTVDWGKKGLVDYNAGETQQASFWLV